MVFLTRACWRHTNFVNCNVTLKVFSSFRLKNKLQKKISYLFCIQKDDLKNTNINNLMLEIFQKRKKKKKKKKIKKSLQEYLLTSSDLFTCCLS